MGLSSLDISQIDRQKIGRQLRTPSYLDDAKINGFDTETRQDGQIYVLSYVYDGPEWGVKAEYNRDKSPLDSDLIFRILTANQTLSPAVNVWFNLDFDANALFNTTLSDDNLKELADTNQTRAVFNGKNYQITYIPHKFLTIAEGRIDEQDRFHTEYKSTHYDIAQFFNSSLKKASQNWLDLSKIGVDPTDYDDFDEFIRYAKRDAEVTQKLWQMFTEIGEHELGVPLGKPISTGFVAQQNAFERLNSKPKWGSSHFQKMAGKAYHGGRFEVYRRGFFDSVLGLDINSAYPFHMSQMPDLGTCDIRIIGGKIADMRAADWGFVTATVSTDSDRQIQPFPIKAKKVVYPALDSVKLTVTIDEFLFALDHGYLTDYEIHKTGLVFEDSNVTRPFNYLKDDYDDRLSYKDQISEKGDRYDKFQFIIKVIMNSIYGKTCQVTEKYERLDPDTDFEPSEHEFITEGYTGDMLKGRYEAGELFNPFYATYITAKTRLQLHEAVLNLGVEDETIMLATDCLMIEDSAVSEQAIDDMLAPRDLGAWDFDYQGSAFVVGSGVYDVFDGDNLKKLASRGFRELTKNYDSWRQAAEQANGQIELKNERPARFKEYLVHLGNPRKERLPGQFFEDSRTLKPNFDTKRRWQRDTDFDDLLRDNHGSGPITISS